MKIINTFLILLALLFSFCKQKPQKHNSINLKLRNRLKIILNEDQRIRELLSPNISQERRSKILNELNLKPEEVNKKGKIFSKMSLMDSLHLVEIEKIIEKYGYPSRSLVGDSVNQAVFYVIQHSNKIEKYLPIMKKAASKGELKKTSLALMEDRYLMRKGKEQIYGTQIRGEKDQNGNWFYFIWPVKKPDSVDVLRKEIGFEKSIEEYAKDMNIPYKLYTLEEIKSFQTNLAGLK